MYRLGYSGQRCQPVRPVRRPAAGHGARSKRYGRKGLGAARKQFGRRRSNETATPGLSLCIWSTHTLYARNTLRYVMQHHSDQRRRLVEVASTQGFVNTHQAHARSSRIRANPEATRWLSTTNGMRLAARESTRAYSLIRSFIAACPTLNTITRNRYPTPRRARLPTKTSERRKQYAKRSDVNCWIPSSRR
jgi:hypothetical protein